MDVVLVLDVGNSNTKIGLYRGSQLHSHWRLSTTMERTSDELGMMISGLVQSVGVAPSSIQGVVVSSVVPAVMPAFIQMCQQYFHAAPMVVGPGIKTGLDIKAENPREVGADRIVNAVAAMAIYRPPLIIVDFGTATTFCVVDGLGHYVGGAIAPGVRISADALFRSAAKLPQTDLAKPKSVIGKHTTASMQSGIYYGFVGLVEGLVARIHQEMPADYTVVATGGLAELMAPEIRCIQHVQPFLTLEGLRLLWERNKER